MAHSHERDVISRAGPFQYDVGRRFIDDIANKEYGQGKVVLIIGKMK